MTEALSFLEASLMLIGVLLSEE